MKKKFWMLGVAVAALTSCTQSEVVDVPESKLIGFDSFVDKPTRALAGDIESVNDFDMFYVFGSYGTKNGDKFTREDGNRKFYLHNLAAQKSVSGSTVTWNYEKRQWIENKIFRFAAYADGKSDAVDPAQIGTVEFIENTESTDLTTDFVGTDNVSNRTNSWGLKFTDYVAENKDLVAAVPLERSIGTLTAQPLPVALSFRHLLSKVIFEVENQSDNIYLKVEPINLTISDKGDCLALYGERTNDGGNIEAHANVYWKPSTTTTTKALFDNHAPLGKTTMTEEFYVIPQSNDITLANIVLKSVSSDGNSVYSTFTIPTPSLANGAQNMWLPGVVYRYIITYSPGGYSIEFTATADSWSDAGYANKPLQN